MAAQDVRAHLRGGVPGAEVESRRAIFDAHGFDAGRLLTKRADGYQDLLAAVTDRGQLKARIEGDAGVVAKCSESLPMVG